MSACLLDERTQVANSLQEICLAHILWTLEEYPVDVLALLPKAIREEMLHNLPIVDICRLEDTQFTSGIDMDSIWKELYESHMNSELFLPYSPYQSRWRQKYLKRVLTIILQGRPYDAHEIHHKKVGIVNYLVAVKRSQKHQKRRNEYSKAYCCRRRWHIIKLSRNVINVMCKL